MRAAQVAKVLGGVPNGAGFLVRCPCAGHGKGKGDRRPSLSIRDGAEVLLVCCFAGCDPRDVLNELRRRGLLDDETARRRAVLPSTMSWRHDIVEAGITKGDVDTSPSRSEAVQLWRPASPVVGTAAERYLQRRGITNAPPSLRYVTGYEYIAGRVRLPALVAAVQNPDRAVTAVQLTFLRPDGLKAPVAMPRKTVGLLGAGAVRLAAAGPVLGLAEGTETALAAMQLTGVPTWASLGAARMHRVAVPDVVRELHLFGDADEAGRAAVERTAAAHRHRRVVIRLPPAGSSDWADALMREAVPA